METLAGLIIAAIVVCCIALFAIYFSEREDNTKTCTQCGTKVPYYYLTDNICQACKHHNNISNKPKTFKHESKIK